MRLIIIIITMFFYTNIYATNLKEVNGLYYSLLDKYKSNTTFTRNLIDSQKSWEKYVDSQIKLIYESSSDEKISIRSSCIRVSCDHLYQLRIEELKDLESDDEYELCNFNYEH